MRNLATSRLEAETDDYDGILDELNEEFAHLDEPSAYFSIRGHSL